MGPSGAGKDTLLAYARQRIGEGRVLFAHRYITRPPIPGDENFIELSEEEFAERRRLGLFAMHWRANGLSYAIGAEIGLWRQTGAAVVVSGSRQHFAAALARSGGVTPVVVTARPEVIAARLAERGREDAHRIAARIGRGAAFTIDHPLCVTIDNSGSVEEAGERLVDVVMRAAMETA
ncbi:MAG: phosphonate metabolism protein/1,5-bisphosphokinase (PRPP-forming) PhnN [Alphaproteobacteria bacterium]|nr:phosphonate metabolism protein/1,5-bisphosphokinase (PRPP-forming) PhnN [Alphaproteobacteria bacterium]